MRYLNRIILINSTHIKYAEINLDGNVHFIGTQGVGKSTLLRAILFFYNADTLGLGIPKQKTSYTDYYFQKANAYIIYEVVRNEEKFCVVSYKAQHKICFRFFDGEYKQEYFVNENGKVPDGWEGIAQKLDLKKIFYTKRKIDEYKEYKDILYGNHEGIKNELKRYSILESKDYLYIPKTIQNVFLNSKMEAEFIKQTIIMSLENDIKIDLNNYIHHLRDFETQLEDIRKFKTPGTYQQAISISKLHISIKHLEKEKNKLATELVWALNSITDKEPELVGKLDTEENKEVTLIEKLSKLSESFKTKENKIRNDIGVVDSKIKEAKNKTEEYEKKNINQIIERVSNKPELVKQQKYLLSEKELLTSQFKELALKFQALLEKLENRWSDFSNGINAEKNKVNSEFLNFKEKQGQIYEKLIADLRKEHKIKIDTIREEWDYKKQISNELKVKREGLKHKQFFETEIISLRNEINIYKDSIKTIKTENENFKRQIENLQKEWQLDENEILKTLGREKEKLDEQTEEVNKKITKIDTYLDNSKESLYGWLSENYVGWENTIGRVIDEGNVLFNPMLSPKLAHVSNSFYGLEIDLNEIKKTVKTVVDYEKEKQELIEKNKSIRKNISELFEVAEKEKENLKKKHQPKIREKNNNIKENEYLAGINQAKLNGSNVKYNDFVSNAVVEKNKAIDTIDDAIEKSIAEELMTKAEVGMAEEELNQLIKSKEKERAKKIDLEQETVTQNLLKIETKLNNEKEIINKRRADINAQKLNELTNKGADTERLSEIEQKITLIGNELDFIEGNISTVSDYNKDKRELFDRVPEYKQQKQTFDRQLELEEKKYTLQKETINKDLQDIKEKITSFKKILDEIKEDNEEFKEFNKTECFNSIQQVFTNTNGAHKTDKRVKVIISEIRDIHYDKFHKQINELRKTITDFLGKFNDNNILKFKKQLIDDNSFLDFSVMLADFVEENKIERIEKEVNERFSEIIKTIGSETTSLVSAEGKIQSVIKKINDDFIEKNFVGAIKKIELKIDETKNEVVILLKKIKQFNDENHLELGKANLFSSDNQEKKNKEAIDLLKQFVKKIGEMKRDYITLSDSFELKFRIEENQNDTGWVEKLSNVGSDGTDVLIKAMVNIMLLNVFKEGASKRFKDFQLHCMMDEIGKLHPENVRGILKFANDRNILLINSSPIENDALAFKHIYKLRKDEIGVTRVNRILTQFTEA